MDKTEIAQIASQMSTREELLALLNRIKQDEMRELGFDADKFYPFTMKQLLYYCNPNHEFIAIVNSIYRRNLVVFARLQHRGIGAS